MTGRRSRRSVLRASMGAVAAGVAGCWQRTPGGDAQPRSLPAGHGVGDPPAVAWDRTYGDGGQFTAVAATTEGVVAAGERDDGGWVLRADVDGRPVRSDRLDPPGTDGVFFDVRRTGDGYLLGGAADEFSRGWLAAVGQDGGLLWRRTYRPGPDNYRVRRLFPAAPTPIVLGNRESFDDRRDSAWVAGLDAAGRTRWHRFYWGNNLGIDDGLVDEDGRLVVAGSGYGEEGLWLAAVDAGRTAWRRTYPGQFGGGVVEADEGFLVAGSYDGAGREGLVLVRTDDRGRSRWRRRYAVAEEFGLRSFVRYRDGGLVVAALDDRSWLAALAADGTVRWTTAVPGTLVAAEPTAIGIVAVGSRDDTGRIVTLGDVT